MWMVDDNICPGKTVLFGCLQAADGDGGHTLYGSVIVCEKVDDPSALILVFYECIEGDAERKVPVVAQRERTGTGVGLARVIYEVDVDDIYLHFAVVRSLGGKGKVELAIGICDSLALGYKYFVGGIVEFAIRTVGDRVFDGGIVDFKASVGLRAAADLHLVAKGVGLV